MTMGQGHIQCQALIQEFGVNTGKLLKLLGIIFEQRGTRR
jgi:hypothetical protein